jgi:hypothetical protein
MFNPRVGRFMDSGNVDGRYYVHCTMKVKIFFCTAPFHELRLAEGDAHRQVNPSLLSIETNNYGRIINLFFNMFRGPRREQDSEGFDSRRHVPMIPLLPVNRAVTASP